MTGLEILFIITLLPVLVLWGWFIVQGFRTSKVWGWSLIFLFPVSPFLFAYRFERKTRKAIFYFMSCLAVFTVVTVYAQFFTAGFFNTFTGKFIRGMESIQFSAKTEHAKPLDLPKPTPIPAPLPVTPEQPDSEQVEPEETVRVQELPPRKKTISIDEAKNYVGKSVVISTDSVVHRGKLMGVGMAEIQIKKNLGGGTVIMGVPKSKITKLEVYQ